MDPAFLSSDIMALCGRIVRIHLLFLVFPPLDANDPFLLPCPERRPFLFCAARIIIFALDGAASGDLTTAPLAMSLLTSSRVMASETSLALAGAIHTRFCPHFMIFAAILL